MLVYQRVHQGDSNTRKPHTDKRSVLSRMSMISNCSICFGVAIMGYLRRLCNLDLRVHGLLLGKVNWSPFQLGCNPT